jgi:3-deoxy-manno-octulosonate cytidylyltransferase (CMP-KDO synthetase)
MVWHVYQRALETNIGAENIVVATDHQGIFDVCIKFSIQVVMTSDGHESGTNRLAKLIGWDDDVMVVNLQGDEPSIPPSLIEFTAKKLEDSPLAGMATLGCPINTATNIHDTNGVNWWQTSLAVPCIFLAWLFWLPVMGFQPMLYRGLMMLHHLG